jgi:hypothetical protein
LFGLLAITVATMIFSSLPQSGIKWLIKPNSIVEKEEDIWMKRRGIFLFFDLFSSINSSMWNRGGDA